MKTDVFSKVSKPTPTTHMKMTYLSSSFTTLMLKDLSDGTCWDMCVSLDTRASLSKFDIPLIIFTAGVKIDG